MEQVPFWNQLVQILQITIVSGIITVIVLFNSIEICTEKKNLILFVFAKLIVVNLGWNVVAIHYWGEKLWFPKTSLLFNMFMMPISYYCLYLLIETTFRKMMFILIICDSLVFPISYLPIKLITVMSGVDLTAFSIHALDKWNMVLLIFQVTMLIFLWKFGIPLFRWLNTLELKNAIIWNVIAIGYVLLGVVALYMDNYNTLGAFLSGDMLMAFAMIILVFWILQRYHQKQLAMENHFLKTQQALMQEHYEAMEHYIAQTASYREEIEEQMKTIEEITRDVHDPRLDGYLGALRKQYEELGIK